MSGLARALMRRTVIEALRPTALLGTSDLPTLAAGNVFDSALEPIDDLSDNERKPCIVVYTENEERTRIAHGGPILYAGTVDLVIDLSIIALAPDPEAPGTYAATYPVTDGELENALDLMEEQVDFLLHASAFGALFRKMVFLPFIDWRSHRMMSSEENARIALRTLRARVRLQDFCYEAAPATTPTGLDRLPPGLAAVAKLLPGGSVSANIALGMANAAPRAPIATPLGIVARTVKVGELTVAGVSGNADVVDDLSYIASAAALPTVVASGATVHVDYAVGRWQHLILAANVTSLVVDNWPASGQPARLILDVVNTGNFTLTGAATDWSDGATYAATQGAGKRDRIILTTTDHGTTVDGNVVGQDYHA